MNSSIYTRFFKRIKNHIIDLIKPIHKFKTLKKVYFLMSFSENLREILDIRDIEVKELSAGTGISRNTIDNYLSGQKSLPNAENAVKIAKYIGTTVEFLVLGEANQKNSWNEEINELIKNLKRLKKSDFDSIRAIVKSLAS